MSVDTISETAPPVEPFDEIVQYRALSATAVASAILGLLSAAAFLTWMLGIVPLLGIVTGIVALARIRSRPAELTGKGFALVGIFLSLLMWSTALSYQAYSYVTEVPEGYERLSYARLQPDPAVQGEVYPPDVLELNGRRVFIKGYMYPGSQQSRIKQFVLCRDNGDCCFGGQPKLTDRILVTLEAPLRVDYSTQQRHLAGTFRVEPASAVDGLGGVIYHLDADYVK